MHARAMRPTATEASPYYATYIALVPDGDILATLQQECSTLHALLVDVPDDIATAVPAAGEWSIKQVVQHLNDAERLFAFRALWFARGEVAALPGMEPNPWVSNTEANTRTMRDLLDEAAHIRATTVTLFAQLDEAAWQRAGIASDVSINVRALAWLIAGHELHHQRSLREVYGVGR